MKSLRVALAAIAITLIAEVSAHSRMYGVWVNGTDQGAGAGRYIRQPPTNDPVKDLTSQDIRCNVNGYNPVPTYISVRAGSNVTTEWFHNTRGDDIMASSHKGPIVAYIAPASSNGEGNVWVKIYQDGNSGTWAVDTLLSNRGKYGIPIPSDLAPGKYILRVEIIALHEAYALHSQDPSHGAQFFPSCVQIQVTGSGSKKLPSGVAFPGAYTDSTPGIKWNIYNPTIDQKTYPIPGSSVVDL